jgi:hypothetical protein
MAQPSYIELQTGPDRLYRIAVCVLWLLATAVVIAHVLVLAWPLSAVCSPCCGQG